MTAYFRQGGDDGSGAGRGDGGNRFPLVPPGPEFYFLFVLAIMCCCCPMNWLISLVARR
jgi:hypothetical protein